MVEYDYFYDEYDESETEGYWTRRQVMIVIITFVMILSLLGYMIAPLLQNIVQKSNRSELPPTPIRLETADFQSMPDDSGIEFSSAGIGQFYTTSRA